ncbi:MAG: YbhB/YbcL family Raf kinase inhibitor-like protein [Methanomicrobiales archaeon]|jgi:Raf kinase inhibitor-like YbhB/YbcL family protein
MKQLRLVTRVRERAARAARHLTLVLLFISSGCLISGGRGGAPALDVSSDAFSGDGQIPVVYTCDGTDISPPLSWAPVPQRTASIALLVTDPDAPGGTFIHWTVYNIPPGTRGIPAGAPGKNVLPAGSLEGVNDMGRPGYGGPCPPRGKPHHYHFTVYALDSTIHLTGKRDGRMLADAVTGHILAQGELVGMYRRA